MRRKKQTGRNEPMIAQAGEILEVYEEDGELSFKVESSDPPARRYIYLPQTIKLLSNGKFWDIEIVPPSWQFGLPRPTRIMKSQDGSECEIPETILVRGTKFEIIAGVEPVRETRRRRAI